MARRYPQAGAADTLARIPPAPLSNRRMMDSRFESLGRLGGHVVFLGTPGGLIFQAFGLILGSFLEPWGPFWEPLGVILEALGGPWVTFWTLGGRQKAIYPSDRSASHTFRILSRQNGPKWLPKGSQNGAKIHQKFGQQKGCRKHSEKGGAGVDQDLPWTSKTIQIHCKT